MVNHFLEKIICSYDPRKATYKIIMYCWANKYLKGILTPNTICIDVSFYEPDIHDFIFNKKDDILSIDGKCNFTQSSVEVLIYSKEHLDFGMGLGKNWFYDKIICSRISH